MKIYLQELLKAFSFGLDSVEKELIGVNTNHGKRVAYLSILIGHELGINKYDLPYLAAAAILHDNALTEYIEEEAKKGKRIFQNKELIELRRHSVIGEENVKCIPFYSHIENAILYHHEHADGSGSIGKKEEDTPIFAQIIHISDQVDAKWDLSRVDENKYKEVLKFIKNQSNVLFSEKVVHAFEQSCSLEEMMKMKNEVIDQSLLQKMPPQLEDYSTEEVKGIAHMFAEIVDYKSEFTSRHSIGVAEKALKMAEFYHYDKDTQDRIYFAGAIHDIGKLVIDTDVLEKPDKLTDEEFIYMKNHAYYTYEILNSIRGFEDICRWASYHHEKLNGKGYPFGKTGEELDEKERLMGCIDIYQALTEKRPYMDGMSHEESINIMRDMAQNNFIDLKIVEDIDEVFKATTPE